MTWQKHLQEAIKSTDELIDFINMDKTQLTQHPTTKSFPLLVTKRYASKIKPNPNDPLLLQVWPKKPDDSWTRDPLEEKNANPIPGLIHKYHSRILVVLTGHCAIHCRYCFRQNFAYQENIASSSRWEKILEYINKDPNIKEIIFSGGDPLLVKDSNLKKIIHTLQTISHLKLIRFHTRVPSVLPERITDDFCAIFKNIKQKVTIVTHINHPNELDQDICQACARLKNNGINLLNQSVLLKGVNDNHEVITNLSYKLFEFGIIPYYLHMLDKVSGSQEFDIPQSQAIAIWRDCQKLLPGYLLPKLAREIPQKSSKSIFI